MDSLQNMALFVEVARTRSIKQASVALGIPDSTLSRRVSALEKSLGVRLLHRTTRRIDLTEAGQIYYEQCRQIVDAAYLAQEQLKEMSAKPQGALRLSLPIDFSTLFLAPLIAEFAAAYPLITFDLQLSERWVDLSQEGFDISIRLGLQPDSNFMARQIADVRYELFASPDYIRRNGEPLHPSQLPSHACIRMVCPHWDTTWTLLSPPETAQIKVKDRIAVNNIAMVRRFAVLGVGIAPLDSLLAREELETGLLRRILPQWYFQPVPVFALTPSKILPAKTRTFIDFLVARMNSRAKVFS